MREGLFLTDRENTALVKRNAHLINFCQPPGLMKVKFQNGLVKDYGSLFIDIFSKFLEGIFS